jgi:hypothetical protein
MNTNEPTRRALFVERLLLPREPCDEVPPTGKYDDGRDLTLLADQTPLVESSAVGGTMTNTAAHGESADADLAAWSGTWVETRAIPGRDTGTD